MLWSKSARTVANRCIAGSAHIPLIIHTLPLNGELDLSGVYRIGDPAADLTPHDGALWSETANEATKLERISLRVGHYIDANGDSNETLLGLRVKFLRGYWEPHRYVGPRSRNGSGAPVGWPVDEMVHFDIDGAGGEHITEIAAAWTNELNGFKVRSRTAAQYFKD